MWSGLNQERNMQRSSTIYKLKLSITAQNKYRYVCGLWCERQQEMDFITGGSIIMDYWFTITQLLSSQDVNWWTGVVWIIVMFLSAVWTLILTAPIHCRGSIAETVMQCYISPNLMKKQAHIQQIFICSWTIPFMRPFPSLWYCHPDISDFTIHLNSLTIHCRVSTGELFFSHPQHLVSTSSARCFTSNVSLYVIRLNLIRAGLMTPSPLLTGPFLHNEFFWS